PPRSRPGRGAARLGDPATAQGELEQALAALERLRATLRDEVLTQPFFALRQLYFEGAIGELMDLESRWPGRGFAAAAFAACERAHRRTLIDAIAERSRP